MKIFIQNMVSLRCKLKVKSDLMDIGVAYLYIELGEVNLTKPLSDSERILLKSALHKSGLELMEDENAMLIEKVINIIVQMVHYSDEQPLINFSCFLSRKLNMDYHKVSELFSKTKGITIERFIILHKIERIKELIIYNELNFTEIAYLLNYSSVAHLSSQFKQVTGLTPSFFKGLSIRKRQNLEDIAKHIE